MALNADVSFTWIGHGTWRARSAKGKEILIDPWVMNNPAAPETLNAAAKLLMTGIVMSTLSAAKATRIISTARRGKLARAGIAKM